MFKISDDKCIKCGLCVKDCFLGAISKNESKVEIDNDMCIKCGHCIAVCPKNAVSTDEYNMDDVLNYDKEKFDVDANNLLNFIKFRRTVRHYKNKDVEIDKIEKIIEAGRFTQTATNSQNVSYIVVKENLKELKELTFETLKGLGEHMLANLTPETKMYERYAKMWIQMYDAYKADPQNNDKIFFNAPAIILVTSESEVNASLAASNMELMTNALGLGTLFSGFFTKAAESNKMIRDFVGLKKGNKIVNCMLIGYPDVKYSRTVPRKDADITWK